jgi:hypothetical protein
VNGPPRLPLGKLIRQVTKARNDIDHHLDEAYWYQLQEILIGLRGGIDVRLWYGTKPGKGRRSQGDQNARYIAWHLHVLSLIYPDKSNKVLCGLVAHAWDTPDGYVKKCGNKYPVAPAELKRWTPDPMSALRHIEMLAKVKDKLGT